jgi:hypothetical protein
MSIRLKTIAQLQTTKEKLIAEAQKNCNILSQLYDNLPSQHDLQVELDEFDKMLDKETYTTDDLCECIDRTRDMLDDGRAYLEEYEDEVATIESRSNLNDREC